MNRVHKAKKVELNLDASTLEKIDKIISFIGFSCPEEFLKVAVKKQVDYYTLLLDYEGTGKK